ncbi:hypothetical protein LTS16_001979 [Friedmanniomyces endolithicus]|uniref:Uncharacterized protein n=1 Tax=Friedmanniomyces endolithicus TaxID=329885 RepID=A0AAN6G092_9PEZI|nr:hypothetical protein LTR35_013181 [Friedmanniomyces endolithicus]KAK0298459.1 hypothetical protein LTS00_002839 [Friedmanniomyces endolithicus]KAK0327698.1 hypothetical protein LTR82_001215 [Friedmanniomyces endolithicus]KAK0987578.1 hypothetical protein LTS01_009496 [Friedmanniomyces endolithicus]KAK0989383.1 hypothetical protein LTR54_012502 [Friedmanniomyces endolithicus]
MVALNIVEESNARIKYVASELVAVFVGATNGVGETTVRRFAKYATRPRVYIIGRSEEAGNRIKQECKALNPEGTFVFIQRDTSLMRNVDAVCDEIRKKEEEVNLLFLTIGTLEVDGNTEEGLHYASALTIYARNRFIVNLLPLLQQAQSLRRVVSVYCATYEGQIRMDDFQAASLGLMAKQGHTASVTTLALEAHHQSAPEVSFVRNFPGSVKSGIDRGSIGPLMRTLKIIFLLLAPLVDIPLEQAGDRHLSLCTSARYSVGPEDEAAGVPLTDGLALARGSDGRVGSGVYSIDAYGESASAKVERLLANFRTEGVVERVRDAIEADINGALASDKHR